MASGSERFAWLQYPGVPRVCAFCGRALRVVDVARVHTSYENGRARSRFYCGACLHEGYGAVSASPVTREQRLPVVKALREEGHSERAIAAALKVGKTTVHQDLRGRGGQVRPPELVEPPKTTGLDGKSYPATRHSA